MQTFIFKYLPLLIYVCSLFSFAQAGTLSHANALAMLNNAGITVSSSGGCSNRNNKKCTSLDGIHEEAINGVITLKRASGCGIVITGKLNFSKLFRKLLLGGTEVGHAVSSGHSHGNGWKLDIRKNGEDCITKYIKSKFQKISATKWKAASGNIYFNEGNHWDIQYF